MKTRNFEAARAKEAILPNIKPPSDAVKTIFDITAQMCGETAKREKEAIIRLYLLRAVTENITLREAVAKYKAEKAVANEYSDGVRNMINVETRGNILSYECFVRLVPRGHVETEPVDWQDIEKEFVDFLRKGIGT